MTRPNRFFVLVGGFVCLWLVSLPLASLRSAGEAAGPSDPLDPSYYPTVSTAGIPANVWVTGALAKVHPDAAPGAQQSVQISAARNEFESFQVHVLAPSNPIELSVTVSDFVNAQTGDVISSASNVLVHREAYLDITQLSDANGTLGLTPDPLIPTSDPYFHEARNAFPVTVPVGEVRSAWIDVLAPDTARSGYYSATVTVSDGASVLATVPAVLKLWDFAIPSTASLKSAFGMSYLGLCLQAYGSYENCAQYPGSGNSSDRAIELTHISQAAFALNHRVSISDVVYVGPPSGDWAHFDATYGSLLNGTAGTLLYSAQLTSLRYTPPGYSISPSIVQDWVAHFSAAGWLSALFQYTCDEPPNGCSWSQLASDLTSVHAASSSMKTLVTTDIASATANNVLDDINILVPNIVLMEPQGGSNQRPAYDAWLGGSNRHLWWYQSCSSHESCSDGYVGLASSTWPSYMVDATPVRNRVFQWLAFINRIEGELYYATDYCFAAHPGTDDCPGTDPWVSIYAFGGNGDGTLFYPGTAARIGGTTPVPVSSIRLKLIRDGMEDFEYLKALSDAGEDAFARSKATFITNSYTFNNDPQAMTDAREALGNELHRLAQQGTIETPVISISPATDIASSGLQGGSFSPTSFQYQLSSSPGRANYSISGIPSWLDVSTSSGTLTASATTVTFSVNASANALSPGIYSATIHFNNTTNDQGSTTHTATLTVSASSYALSVGTTGSGTLTSSPAGINCGSTCIASFATGTPVALTATPAGGWSFGGWGGACGGGGSCAVTMNSAQSVTATFVQGGPLASRTFVSAAGSDNNNCSRLAPCRTLAHAIARTAAGGEINTLDPAGYGAVTITKSISIVNNGVGSAGVLVPSGATGITIDAGASDVINLRGLIIEGAGVGAIGIQFNAGKSLTVTHSVVRNLTGNGIVFVPTTASSLAISNTLVANNGDSGILVQPGATDAVKVAFDRVEALNNATFGFAVDGQFSNPSLTGTATDCAAANNGNAGFAINSNGSHAVTRFALTRSVSANNGYGLFVNGPRATLWVAKSVVTGNANGWSNSGGVGVLLSYGDNYIDGNAANETAPTSTIKK